MARKKEPESTFSHSERIMEITFSVSLASHRLICVPKAIDASESLRDCPPFSFFITREMLSPPPFFSDNKELRAYIYKQEVLSFIACSLT